MSRSIDKPEKFYVGMYVKPEDQPEWMLDLTMADPHWFPHVTLHHFGALTENQLNDVSTAVSDWRQADCPSIPVGAWEIERVGGGYAIKIYDDVEGQAGGIDGIWLGMWDDPRIGKIRDTTYDGNGHRLHLSLPQHFHRADVVSILERYVPGTPIYLTGPVLVSNKKGIVVQ